MSVYGNMVLFGRLLEDTMSSKTYQNSIRSHLVLLPFHDRDAVRQHENCLSPEYTQDSRPV
jgi:hypothetical protein